MIMKCPYCGKPLDVDSETNVPVARKIIAIDWNPATRKKYVSERIMEFCSEECGLHYQMSCEG